MKKCQKMSAKMSKNVKNIKKLEAKLATIIVNVANIPKNGYNYKKLTIYFSIPFWRELNYILDVIIFYNFIANTNRNV